MAKTRTLVKRRKAIRNIRKITKTMEMIATSRFKRALDRASQAEGFTRKISELAADLSRSAGEQSHPLLEIRENPKKTLLLVLTSNRGLCGGYNASILREANIRIRQSNAEKVPFDLEVSGKRGIGSFRFQGVPVAESYLTFEDKPTYEQVEKLADKYIKMYRTREIDRVDVAYMKFISSSRQTPVVEQLLPFASLATPGQAPTGGSSGEYEFIPSVADILDELVPVAFKVRLFKCFLDAAVSEQIARRIAMKAATEAAGDLIKSLSRQYNRARQGQITKELAEIIAGAEALK